MKQSEKIEKLKIYLETKLERAKEMLEDNPDDQFFMGVYSSAHATLKLIERELFL